MPDVPDLVERAEALADRLGFARGCTHDTGRLLATLAAIKPEGRLAEAGTGVGAGTAWLASGLAVGATLVSVELDPDQAREASALLAAEPAVTVLEGDWHELLPAYGPFDVLFLDAGIRPDVEAACNRAVSLLAPGGILVKDDLTPLERWPEHWRGMPDRVRDALLGHADLRACEIRVSETEAAILATRVS